MQLLRAFWILAFTNSLLATNSHLICKSVDDVFSEPGAVDNSRRMLQGPPGRIGPKGSRGVAGPVGPVGPPGLVDYDRIRAYIDEKEAKMAMKIEESNNTIQHLEGIIRQMGLCPVYKHDKCFVIVMGSYNHDRGRTKCQELGGFLANIYSEDHLNAIFDYVRNVKMQTSSYLYFNTGMTIKPSTGDVFLRDATPATYLKWHAGYPQSYPQSTEIYIRINKAVTSTNQYLWNSSGNTYNIICEI